LKHKIFLFLTCLIIFCSSARHVTGAEQKASFNKAVGLYLKAAQFRSEGKFEDGLPVVQKAVQELSGLNGGKSTFYAEVLTLYGELLLYTSKVDQAAETLSEAITVLQAASATDQYDFARAACLLAQSMGRLELYPQAISYFETAEKIYKKEQGACSVDYASLLYARGCLNFTYTNYREAIPDLAAAASIWHAHNVESDVRVNDCFGKLAEAYELTGNKEKAEKSLLLAAKTAQHAFGEDSQQYVCSLNSLVAFYKKINNNDLAKRYLTFATAAANLRETNRKQLEKDKAYSKCLPKR